MSLLPHRRFRLAATLTAFLLAFTLAACGGGADVEGDPQGSLKDAVAAIGDWDGVTLEVSFQADAAARASIIADEPEAEEYIDLFLNSSLRMTSVADDDTETQSVAVNVDGTDVFELYASATGTQVSQLSLRVDLPAIMDYVDDPQAQGDIDEALSMAGMFGLQDAANALSAGEWIEITGLDGLMNMMEGLSGADTEEPDEQQIEALRNAFADRTERLIDEDVDVSYVGSDDIGERVRVVVDGPALQRYLDDIAQVLQSNDLLDGVDAAEFDELVAEIPDDAEVTFDAWIDGDELRQIAVDLGAIEDSEIDGEFLVVLHVENFTGNLSAPDASATVDVMSVMGQAMGGAFMGGDDFDFGDDDFDFGDEDFDFGDEDFEFDEEDFDFEGDFELSDDEIDMMLQFMECVTEDELEGFRLIMPEVAGAIEAAVAEGSLDYC